MPYIGPEAYLQKVQTEGEKIPMGKALVEYLRSRKAMPQVNLAPELEDEILGRYSPDENVVSIAPWSNEGTYLHELTHAADTAMGTQYHDPIFNKAPSNPQFEEAYRKLRFEGGRQKLVRKMPGGADFLKKEQDYRGNETELGGWATGVVTDPERSSLGAPAHAYPTIATEQAILLELAQRKKAEEVAKLLRNR